MFYTYFIIFIYLFSFSCIYYIHFEITGDPRNLIGSQHTCGTTTGAYFFVINKGPERLYGRDNRPFFSCGLSILALIEREA